MTTQVSHDHDMTADSVARAKADRDAQRRQIEQATGLRIAENGIVTTRAYVICCPRLGCSFAASARSEGRAIKGLSAHLVKAHHAIPAAMQAVWGGR